MPKLPRHPDLHRLKGIDQSDYLHELDLSKPLWRIYPSAGLYPSRWNEFRHFGPAGARFDQHRNDLVAPPGPSHQNRGILYLADSALTCLAEVFQANRLIDCHFNEPRLAAFQLTRAPRLLDLTGSWPTRAGASMLINAGNHRSARRWAKAIYETYPDIEGLFYCSSMNANQPCIALFERARDAVPAAFLSDRALADPNLRRKLLAAAGKLGYRLY